MKSMHPIQLNHFFLGKKAATCSGKFSGGDINPSVILGDVSEVVAAPGLIEMMRGHVASLQWPLRAVCFAHLGADLSFRFLANLNFAAN